MGCKYCTDSLHSKVWAHDPILQSNHRHSTRIVNDGKVGILVRLQDGLGKLLELEYSSSDEILSEGNRNKESRACRSKRHGRGWCKFGDSCVVRREGALSENVAQEEQGQGETTEKKTKQCNEICQIMVSRA